MRQTDAGEQLTKSILLGLAQGDYERVASQFVDGFGLSQSSVSRRFQKRAEQALQEFEDRSPKTENFLALWIDGKHVAGEQMIACMGVTKAGYKKVLGFTQVTTENARPIIEMLRDLVERGLTFSDGILCVIDGAKGLRKAVDEVFGACAPVQRCQWLGARKCGQLSAEGRPICLAKKLQRSYREATYEAAKGRLLGLHAELEPINRTAVASL
jgi:transposase-like protein